ncbi:twin-arginine translocation signal domain-containing protein [Sulfurovum sp. ST-21]|uniref:Twin-arginine translocation signal domain-containing protein n=1 Tax=Sulfurovum indicum TaxID=2779528 RepID=A0A7M1S7C4_9BACT|nr:twin-arginine translocation signal domain-containing protein [Sulfurovum indicum]QOR62250.1 twin-arginine translocation signal domain-containing protein [Sulfurovum indicum]
MREKKKLQKPIVSEKVKNKRRDSRRSFLKKAAYAAPALVTLGQLARPSGAYADGSTGPSGPPTDGWTV